MHESPRPRRSRAVLRRRPARDMFIGIQYTEQSIGVKAGIIRRVSSRHVGTGCAELRSGNPVVSGSLSVSEVRVRTETQ